MTQNLLFSNLGLPYYGFEPFELNHVAPCGISRHNCIMVETEPLFKFKDLLSKNTKCVIFVDSVIYHESKDYLTIPDSDSIIVKSDNPYELLYTILKEKFVTEIFEELKENTYDEILKKSFIVSKSTKIYYSKIGSNCIFHHNTIVGIPDFVVTNPTEGVKPKLLPHIGKVKIGDNLELHPYSIICKGIYGITRIGNDVKIGPNSIIGHDCIIGDSVVIGAHSIIKGGSIIKDGVHIPAGTIID